MSPRIRWSDAERRRVWKYIYKRYNDGSIVHNPPTGLKFWEKFKEVKKSPRTVMALNKYYRTYLRLHIADSHLSEMQIEELRKALMIDSGMLPKKNRWTKSEKREVWMYIYNRFKDGSILYRNPTRITFWKAYIKKTKSARRADSLQAYYRKQLRPNLAKSPLKVDQIDELVEALTIKLSLENEARLKNRRRTEAKKNGN